MATEVAVPAGAGAEVRRLVRRWLPDRVVRVGVCMELGEGRTDTTVKAFGTELKFRLFNFAGRYR